ncbi:hypothetical protein DFH08DRAFT_946394 [Mycena albidolilacea]|uniref:Uncharacterized protein n=1 Tax=Mycena albidolilacea TaxID=1033008 RepID=A0AAD6YWN1_9AGAR|nr:hypothetical protein DFH08DRAFT_946394 [Mycena albidolilacea]
MSLRGSRRPARGHLQLLAPASLTDKQGEHWGRVSRSTAPGRAARRARGRVALGLIVRIAAAERERGAGDADMADERRRDRFRCAQCGRHEAGRGRGSDGLVAEVGDVQLVRPRLRESKFFQRHA